MTSKQRTIIVELKREAVQLVKSSGNSAAQVARDLGISDSALSRWMIWILFNREKKLGILQELRRAVCQRTKER